MKAKFFMSLLALLVFSSVVFAAENCTKEGGKDYYSAGIAIVGSDEYPDDCVGDVRLVEYYCSESSQLEYEYYDCEVACVDGSCSGTSTSNETGNMTCVEDWKCSDWSACANNQQARACDDLNECGTTVGKPLESQSCTPTTPVPTPSSGFAKYRYYIIGGIVLLLIILYFVFREKPSSSMPVEVKKEEEK